MYAQWDGTTFDIIINGAIALAAIRMAQGRLRQAMRTYEQALQLATEQGPPVLRGTAWVYVWFFRAIPRYVLLIICGNIGLLYKFTDIGVPDDYTALDREPTPIRAALAGGS